MSCCCTPMYMSDEYMREYTSGAVNNNVVYIEQNKFKDPLPFNKRCRWKRWFRFCKFKN